MTEFNRCLSIKSRTKVHQIYDSKTLQFFLLKKFQLFYYRQILTEILTESHELPKGSPLFDVIVDKEKLDLFIVTPYYCNYQMEKIIRELSINHQQTKNKDIAVLAMNFFDELVRENRPFFPTAQNIYVFNNEVFLNKLSLVGLDLIQFKADIPKLDFMEICSILPAKLLKDNRDYVMVRQFAILVFILRFIFHDKGTFLRSEEISNSVSVRQAQSLLEVQRRRREKFLRNSKVTESIGVFEKETNMRISLLVSKILIEEKEISWPEFVSYLIPPTVKDCQMNANLIFLVNHNWSHMSDERKSQLIKQRYVSIKQIEEQFNEKDTDFLLMRLTNTHFSHLLTHSCMSSILISQSNFDMVSYNLWMGFIKMLPFDCEEASALYNEENESRKQSQETHVGQQKGIQKSLCQKDEKSFPTLPQNILAFFLKFASKKLRNKVQKQQKYIVFEHCHLQTLKKYDHAFR